MTRDSPNMGREIDESSCSAARSLSKTKAWIAFTASGRTPSLQLQEDLLKQPLPVPICGIPWVSNPRSGFVTCYRSATVADSHGVPWVSETVDLKN